MIISFFVPGVPRPGGSKQGFLNKKTGKVNIVEDCKKNPEWRQAVKVFAMKAYNGPVLMGAVELQITFIMPRPRGHYGSGRNSTRLKDSAPKFCTTKPDCTKLVRSLEDSLKGIIWHDDSSVVGQLVDKRYAEYGERSGAQVTITLLS